MRRLVVGIILGYGVLRTVCSYIDLRISTLFLVRTSRCLEQPSQLFRATVFASLALFFGTSSYRITVLEERTSDISRPSRVASKLWFRLQAPACTSTSDLSCRSLLTSWTSMGNKLSTEQGIASESPPESVMMKKKEELIVVDALLEEGINDGDSRHLCLDKTLLLSSGHTTFGPKDLEDVLASVRKTKLKLNKLSVMFNNTGAQGVGSFIAQDKNIKEVTLLCENISADSIEQVAEALCANRTVTKLFLGGRELQQDAARALGEVLRLTSSLRQLTFFNCDIRDEGAEYLASGLAVNKTLQQLDLTFCGIGAEGAAAISRAVRSHPLLGHLNLKKNAVGTKGSSALANALRGNFVIRQLILGSNRVGNGGAVALAGALKVNTTLAYLDLEANDITDDGGIAIAEGLAQNVSLRHLNLRKNAIGSEACEQIRVGWNKRNAKESVRREQPWHDGLSLPF